MGVKFWRVSEAILMVLLCILRAMGSCEGYKQGSNVVTVLQHKGKQSVG